MGRLFSLVQKALPEFNDCAKQVAENTKFGGAIRWKSVMLWNLIRYGARPIDYVRFEFYRKNSYEKDRYMTIYRYFSIVKRLQKEVPKELRGDKIGEYKYFNKFIKRDWIEVTKNTEESTIREFITKHKVVIAKPNNGEQGKGVMKISDGDKTLISDFLIERKNCDYVLEECLKNAPEIDVINPTSLNTVRVYSFMDGSGNVRILGVMLRVGAPGSHVDNWGSGGVGYNFDIETGICNMPGKDKRNKKYLFHPGSNIQMIGFKLHNYYNLVEYIENLCHYCPNARFVGWDIAVTPNGFDLVEMNCPGGHDFLQVFDNPVYDLLIKNW